MAADTKMNCETGRPAVHPGISQTLTSFNALSQPYRPQQRSRQDLGSTSVKSYDTVDMSDEPAAGRLSPKPLRFVPYDPNRKNSRKQRRPNGEGLRGSGATRSDSASRLDADTPLGTRGSQEAAAVVDAGQSGHDIDGFSNASAPSYIGEWYQAMGFGFLPHQEGTANEQVSTRETSGNGGLGTSSTTQRRNHGPSYDDLPTGSLNASQSSAAADGQLRDPGQFDLAQWPLALDHLHSWEDILKESSDKQIAGTHPTRPPTFSIPVFRWFGNTSIAPGIVKTEARIKQLDRKRTGNDSCSPALEREGFVDTKTSLFDAQDTTYPSATALDHLLEVFITHFMCHFPFMNSAELRRLNQNRELSKGLVNSICALASRFSDLPSFLDANGNPDFSICDAYSDAAKQALLPLLAIPTLEVLQSYILLTWSEWGNGRDAGFWMYSGICVRMAQDLGLAVGPRSELVQDPTLTSQDQLTFWAVFFLDRVVSYGTGRAVTLAEEDIQIPLPHDSLGGVYHAGTPHNPWFAMIRILRYRGMVGDIINSKKMKGNESASLAFLQREMADYYQSLPPSLQFTPKNFQLYKRYHQTSTFTIIHLLFHSTIILLHRPSLLQAVDANINFAMMGTLHERSSEISRSSARSIADILHYVELLGPTRAIYCNLFVDHALFLTAMSFLADLAEDPHDTDSMLSILAETQFKRCRAALRKLASYWGGADFVLGVTDQRSAGLIQSHQKTLEGRTPRPIVVEYALDRLPGGFLPAISMTRQGSPVLGEEGNPDISRTDPQPDQGLSFVGSLDPEPQDGRQLALVGQAWLGSNLLSLDSGSGADGQESRLDNFMLFQDPYG